MQVQNAAFTHRFCDCLKHVQRIYWRINIRYEILHLLGSRIQMTFYFHRQRHCIMCLLNKQGLVIFSAFFPDWASCFYR